MTDTRLWIDPKLLLHPAIVTYQNGYGMYLAVTGVGLMSVLHNRTDGRIPKSAADVDSLSQLLRADNSDAFEFTEKDVLAAGIDGAIRAGLLIDEGDYIRVDGWGNLIGASGQSDTERRTLMVGYEALGELLKGFFDEDWRVSKPTVPGGQMGFVDVDGDDLQRLMDRLDSLRDLIGNMLPGAKQAEQEHQPLRMSH